MGAFTGVENITVDNTATTLTLTNDNLTVTEGSGGSYIIMGDGNQSINMGTGNDTAGINVSYTWDANDSLVMGAGITAVVLSGTGTNDFTLGTFDGVDSILMTGGATNITLDDDGYTVDTLSTDQNESITSGAGDDTIIISGLHTQDANDSIDAGGGTDTLSIRSGGTVDLTAMGAFTNVEVIESLNSATNLTVTNDAMDITMGSAADTFTGGTAADTLASGSGADSISAGRGADDISAENDNDTVVGGYGGDSIDGGAGDDLIYADGMDFKPTDISGNTFWLDPTDITTLTLSGTNIIAITNKGSAGSAIDLTGAGASAPTLATSQVNGYNTILFDGGDELVASSVLGSNLFSSNSTSIFAVQFADSAKAQHATFAWNQGSSDRVILHAPWSTDNVIFDYGDSTSNVGRLSQPVVPSTIEDNWHILNTNKSSGVGDINVDGNQIISAAMTDTLNTALTADFHIGSSDGSNYFQDYIGDVIIYNQEITDAQKDQVNEYLSYKYGIALSGQSFGADTVTGGTGNDTFVWNINSYSVSGNLDQITDFEQNADDDTIYLDYDMQFTIVQNTAGGAFSNVAGEVIWTEGGGNTTVQIDFGGDGTADFEMQVTGTTGLDLQDFAFGNVHATTGADTLNGGFNNDTLSGGYGGDTINGGAGDDLIYADNQAFDANSFGGLQLWLDASLQSSVVTNSSGNITGWQDQSSAGNNAVNNGTPVLNNNGIGGRATVTTSNNNQFTVGDTSTFKFLHDGSDYSVFVVAQTTSTNPGNFQSLLATSNTSFTNSGLHISLDDRVATSSNEEIILTALKGDAGEAYYSISGGNDSFDYSQGNIVDVVFDNGIAGDDVSFEVNDGDFSGSVEPDSSPAPSSGNSSLPLHVGGTTAWDFYGDIGEVLIFNTALTSTQRSQINEYLSHKYGVALNGKSFGADQLTGGTGDDIFIWNDNSYSNTGNLDLITDFEQNADDDTIYLDFNMELQLVQNTAGGAFSGAAGEVIWTEGGGNTTVQIDFGGDSSADFQVQATGSTGLNSQDIVFGNAHATTGADTLNGGVNNDTLSGGYGGDTIDGGAGDDTIYADNREFDLASFVNLALWLDASNTANVSYDSNGLIKWFDQSGNNYDAAPGTSRVTYDLTTNDINGRGVIRFDGTDDNLITDSFTTTDDQSIFIVSASGGNNSRQLLNLNGPAGPHVVVETLGGELRTRMFESGGDSDGIIDSSVSYTGGSNFIASYVYDQSVRAEQFINGASQGSDTVDVSGAAGQTSVKYIGSHSNPDSYFDGQIAEVIIINEAIDATQRAEIDQYLSYKYGIALDGLSFGVDSLTGGTGNDTFIWGDNSYSNTGSLDIITDFEQNSDNDTIYLQYAMELNLAQGTAGGTFDNVIGELIWTESGGNTTIQIDYNGDSTADVQIQASGTTGLDTEDFAFQNVTGSRDAETINGGNQGDTIAGGYGGDTMDGGAGNDIIYADGRRFDPNDLGNLILWLNATDLSSFTLDNGQVTQWRDSSGNGNHAITGTGTTTYTASALNGRFAITSGTSDYLDIVDSPDFNITNNLSIFGVAERTVDNGTDIFVSKWTALGNKEWALNVGFGVADAGGFTGSLDGDNTTNGNSGVVMPINSEHIVSATFDGSTIVSGVDGQTNSTAFVGNLFNGTSELRIGGHPNAQFEGNVGDVLIFDTVLSDAQRDEIDEYLALKYGIALNGTSLGVDSLTGGTGDDVFVWTDNSYSLTGNMDVITDFEANSGDDDKVYLSFEIELTLVQSTAGGSFGDEIGEVIWTESGGDTTIQIDFGGDSTADFEVLVDNTTGLTTDDIQFGNVHGSDAADTINGGFDDDTLSGGYNGDSINGGAGDDIIYPDNRDIDLTLIAGLQGWYDASDQSSITLDENNDVSVWYDKSGNNNNLTQTTDADQPLYSFNAELGRAELNFDGVNEYMTFDSQPLSGTSARTFFFVGRADTTASGEAFLSLTTSDTTGRRYDLTSELAVRISGANRIYNENVTSATNSSVFSFSSASGATVSGTDGFLNGTALTQSSVTNGGTSINTGTAGSSKIGANHDSSGYLDGAISEILVFDTELTTAQTEMVHEYLSFKYGIALSGTTFGTDTLTGGDGDDTFVFNDATYSTSANTDSITDFESNAADDDSVYLNYTMELQIVQATAGGSFTGNFSGEVIWTESGGDTTIAIDFGTDSSSDMEVDLTDSTGLDLQDIQFGHARGTTGDESIYGGFGDDSLNGSYGDDTIIGGAGDDTLIGGLGGDEIRGGEGNDRIYADNREFSNNLFGDLQLWLDASDLSTLTLSDTNTVTQWNDKSLNGYSATVDGGGQAADYVAGGQNGLGIIDFGTSDIYSLGNVMNFEGETGLTFIAVMSADADDTGYSGIVAREGATRGYYFGLNGGQIRTQIATDGVGNYHVGSGSTDLRGAGYSLITSLYDGNAATNQFLIDGTQDALDSTGLPSAVGDSGPSEVLIGNDGFGPGAAANFKGNMAEILVFDRALTTRELEEIESGLALKWGNILTGESFEKDLLYGGAGADTFVWTQQSHSGVGANRDNIFDWSGRDGEGDRIDLSDFTGAFVYIGTQAFTSNGMEVRNNAGILEVDKDGDGTSDFDININNTDTVYGEDFVGDIEGTSAADSLTASSTTGSSIQGRGGNDTITGSDLQDYLSGGDDDDSLDGGRGYDGLEGGQGDDTLIGGYGGDFLDGSEGNDIIYADNERLDLDGMGTLNLWLDSSDWQTVLRDGDGTVYQWNDKSGQGNNATQSSASDQPTYLTTTTTSNNERPLVDFAIDYMDLPDGTISVSDDRYSIFVVFNSDDNSNNRVLLGAGEDVNNQELFLRLGATNLLNTGWWNSNQESAANTINTTDYFSVSSHFDGTSAGGTRYQYINGEYAVDTTDSTAGKNTATANNYIGAVDTGGVASKLDGQLTEIIVFNSFLTDADRASIEEYLAHKYAVALSGTTFAADTLTGGAGDDVFVWTDNSHSTNATPDHITDFSQSGGNGDDTIYFNFETQVLMDESTGTLSSILGEFNWAVNGSDTDITVDYNGDGDADFRVVLDNFTSALTLSDFQFGNVLGSTIAESINGGFDADTIAGGYGADTLVGGSGNDVIYGDGDAFDPTMVAGLSFWVDSFDPNADGTLVSNGTNLATWSDKSANGFDATAAGGQQADFGTSANGVLPGLDFNGTSDWFAVNSLASVIDNNHSVLAVFRSASVLSEDNYFLSAHTAADGNNELWGIDNITGQLIHTDGNQVAITASDYRNENVIFSSILDDVNMVTSANRTDDETNLDNLPNTATTKLSIGQEFDPTNTPSNWFDGVIHEVIVYDNDIAEADRDQLELYLSYKYGFTLGGISLGSDTLTGGAGADTFVWNHNNYTGTGASRDVITDFSRTDGDTIDLSGFPGSFTFRSGGNGAADFTGNIRQIAFDAIDGDTTVVYIDIDGDDTTEFEIELTGGLGGSSLVSGDFIL